MAEKDYIPVVEMARSGNATAFADLVIRFQDMAVGSAYSWLGDIELAREISQEAFLDAHLHMHQLRTAAAFPGWFRRIVLKHCDRATRQKRMLSGSLDAARNVPTNEPTPESILQLSEQREHLRLAVEALPEEQRLVVSLHYFAEVTGNAISEFLEMPLAVIKKRLRDARGRLVKEGDQLMRETVDKMRPSKTDCFSNEITFFIALRQGDLDEVKRLITIAPELVKARQNWHQELVSDGILPFASKATALITAIEMDDLAMLRLLLQSGADINGECGCETAESPIWAATLLNRVDHARQLLAQGANPNVYSASGNTPLHVAAMRGCAPLVQLLLDHGADPQARDRKTASIRPLTPTHGRYHQARIPIEWAAANGHDAVIEIFQANDNGAPQEQTHDISEKPQVTRGPVVHTGIKALDFFVPLPRAGLIRLPFQAGVGMLVLLGELSHRYFSTKNGSVVWTGFTHPPFDTNDWEAEMSEFGLKQHIHHSLVSFKEDAAKRRQAFDRGIRLAEALRDEGREVLAIVQSTEGFEHDIETSLHRLSRPSEQGCITTIVITPWKKERWSELKPPYSAQIALDRTRANKGLFPAIDPGFSLSLATSSLAPRHLELVNRVKAELAWYRNIDVELNLEPQIPDHPDHARIEVIRALFVYFCQPFVVTEPFSGVTGEQVKLEDLLGDIESILNSPRKNQ